MAVLTADYWDQFLLDFPDAHILQSRPWGELKAAFGWEPVFIRDAENGAQILFRKLPLGITIAYIPKGPLGPDWGRLWPEIDKICKKQKAIFLRVEPDLPEDGVGKSLQELLPSFHYEVQTIQPRRTILVDLTGGEEAWLARMKQKTRYNIKLAERRGVKVRLTDDVNTFYRLAQITGQRDGFGIHTFSYYEKAYTLFAPKNQCALLLADYEDQSIAGLMVFALGNRAWYFYGASTDEERNRMPTYLLQQEAMKWAYQRGCLQYDLWGIPDYDEDILERDFTSRADGLWGVYRFKRGFGGAVVRSIGAMDKVYHPLLYYIYKLWSRRGEAQAG